MGGGLMQLVAYGAQDVYLTGNAQITFWKVTYRRHTHFAMESIEQPFNGQAEFGRRVACTIRRNGDHAYKTYLQVTLPRIDASDNVSARWLDYPGEHLVHHVEVEVGGQRVDRQYGDWMHIWNQLTLTAEAKRGYDKMVGQTVQLTQLAGSHGKETATPCNGCGIAQDCVLRNALPETTLYVPLQFWVCRNPGLALPLIALQYHEVKINIELRPIEEMLWAVKGAPATGDGNNANGCADTEGKNSDSYRHSLVAASLYVDYVFLDTDERRRMAQNPHEYLIEQLQYTGDESIGSSSNKIKLNFNHPVKELVWVVQKDEVVDYCASTQVCGNGEVCGDCCNDNCCGGGLYAANGAQPFNYTDAIDVLPNGGVANFLPIQTIGSMVDDCDLMGGTFPFIPNNTNVVPPGGVNGTIIEPGLNSLCGTSKLPVSGVSVPAAVVLAQSALDKHCWGQNPVVVAKLQLNGQDRFSEREGTYFDLVQPYQHPTRNPDTGINVYSFALRPEEHQPSGTANFSRIDNATLQMVVSNNTVRGSQTAHVRVYATNYNVLRVMSGMGGLAYSNLVNN